ncbi:class I SAM-dependent methyltransferase [Geodermatophilus sp. DSM 44513]|uniref:class I SAM-dependent methyltransferase n=1 Tax=Geodermatophilus sp. DSM 44513 TaxID=1528104 RepID=UPI00127AC384|nr:class I SAM-dependent methyltransferase [Geodermatophilus sp. DSM 44513]WNV77626.1 class I SAM-dependent methyltransferase [Geodermatophilus sp. DSM 44513]
MEQELAAGWVERWDAQQERYAHRREERFAVIVDLVRRATAGDRAPVVLDLGAGPGSLAARVADGVPGSRVLAFECDPVLVAIGRSWCGDRVEFVEEVVGAPGWSSTIPAGVAAAVSSTALHYPSLQQLRSIYADVHRLLRPGGLMANADHFGPPDRTPHDPAHLEPWHSWWRSAADAPELAEAFTLRRSAPAVNGDNRLTVQDHAEALTAARFVEVEAIWRDGRSAVIAARRPH